MSGIVAIWNRDGAPLDERLLLAMTARMEHRGPDAAGHWISGPVGLGHRMLRATPESATEQQPRSDPNRTIASGLRRKELTIARRLRLLGIRIAQNRT